MKHLILLLISTILVNTSIAQCVDESTVTSFTFNNSKYEVIKTTKTWVDAATCAVERGGYLAEINSEDEQNAIFDYLKNSAGINVSNTRAPDGGGGAYVWLGGNDLANEGAWYWDGTNSGKGTQFWLGDKSGKAINDAYTNWGNEPDDYDGQDALGLSLNGWPLGVEGQWNDVDHENELYFIVEYEPNSIESPRSESQLEYYPNPFTDNIFLKGINQQINSISILSVDGKTLFSIRTIGSKNLDIETNHFNSGIYILNIEFEDGTFQKELIFKN